MRKIAPGKSSQRGAVAIMTGLMVAVLIGFLGLAVDLGRMFVIKSELQTAMDSCALAAASQLRPGLNDPDALDRAIAYGRTPQNRANFQGTELDPDAIQFSFSATLNGPYTSYSYEAGGAEALANTAQYARCTYPLADIPVLFMRVLNSVTETTVAATAVGTLAPSQTNCGFPIAVCRESTATATMNPPWGLTPGDWVGGLGEPNGGPNSPTSGPAGCTSGTGTGNFCWADLSPPAASSSELANIIKGQGQCDLGGNAPVGGTGNMTSLNVAWNTRFGIYGPSVQPPGGGGTAYPDLTGYAYTLTNWPSGRNAYPDFVAKRSANIPYNSAELPDIRLNPSTTILDQAGHQQHGRDRRLVLAPIVDCAAFGGGGVSYIPRDAWACVLLLAPINTQGPSVPAKVEYLGLASAPGTPCATSGLGGGTAGPLVPVLVQ